MLLNSPNQTFVMYKNEDLFCDVKFGQTKHFETLRVLVQDSVKKKKTIIIERIHFLHLLYSK